MRKPTVRQSWIYEHGGGSRDGSDTEAGDLPEGHCKDPKKKAVKATIYTVEKKNGRISLRI